MADQLNKYRSLLTGFGLKVITVLQKSVIFV